MTHATGQLDIHDALSDTQLHQMLHPERLQWTPRQLRDLTSRVTVELAPPLLAMTRYQRERRWWARLALTSGVELWLLSWLSGQQIAPHDHGGAAGSFTVLSGTLHEDYRYPGGKSRSRIRHAGKPVGFGAGHAHQIHNPDHAPATSVHAYSPPLVPTREYASLDDLPAEIPPLTAAPVSLAELLELVDKDAP